jgi:hypothetical protein
VHEGSCHCGTIKLTLPSTPTVATDCNCSQCRRIGGPWVYFEFGTVKIESPPEAVDAYVWGDKTLRTVRCRNCGCVTHWEPLDPVPGGKHGVNLGNFDPSLIRSVRVRKFDGADTWTFFDDAEVAAPSMPASMPPPEDAFFHDLERRRTQALVAQDMAQAESLHAPHYHLITPAGKSFSRESYLRAVASGELRYARWEIGAMEVRASSSMAIVRYQALLEFPSGNQVNCWHTDSYELLADGWKAVWSQATAIAPAAKA